MWWASPCGPTSPRELVRSRGVSILPAADHREATPDRPPLISPPLTPQQGAVRRAAKSEKKEEKEEDKDEQVHGECSNLRARLAALRKERAEREGNDGGGKAATDDDPSDSSDLRTRLAKLRAEREANAAETKKSL